MSKKRIFVCSTYREFFAERRLILEFIESDPAISSAFEIITPETISDHSLDPIREIETCDVFIGLIGNSADATQPSDSGLEQQFEQALSLKKFCLVLVKGLSDEARDTRTTRLIRTVAAKLQYRRFTNRNQFNDALRDGLLPQLEALSNKRRLEPGKSYQVFFARSSVAHASAVPRPSIVFSPVIGKENEFGINTHFECQVLFEGQHSNSGTPVHLAFVASDERYRNPARAVADALLTTHEIVIPASDMPRLFTLRPNLQSYRNLIKEVGLDAANELLSATNDLVFFSQTIPRPQWVSTALESNAFNLSFMRTSEAFFAIQNAGSILSGLEHESIGNISNLLHLKFRLPSFKNDHELKFQFSNDNDLPKRIVVIIGKNGVGKSQALSKFLAGLMKKKGVQLTDADGNRPKVQRLLAVSSPGETHATFPKPDASRFPIPIHYQRVFLSKRQSGSRGVSFAEFLIRLARSPDEIRQKSRWRLFCEAVETVSALEDVYVRVKRGEGRPVGGGFPLSELQEGDEATRIHRWAQINRRSELWRRAGGKLVPFSSGQLTFMRFAAQACLHIENGTILLCDEPETHLHPNLITEFVRLLNKLLVETGSYAILATHSAYFVREVPRSQVIVLSQRQAGYIQSEQPRLKTFGADVSAISSFVFEEEPFGFFVTELAREISGAPNGEERLAQLEQELPSEALMYLRQCVESKGTAL